MEVDGLQDFNTSTFRAKRNGDLNRKSSALPSTFPINDVKTNIHVYVGSSWIGMDETSR